MAAEIHPRPQTRKPVLLSKIEGFQDVVNTAVIIPKEDGVISVSQDRTIRVWLKRDSGQYWPSVYHTMPGESSVPVQLSESNIYLNIMGCSSYQEFVLSEDYNQMTPARTYQGKSRIQSHTIDFVFLTYINHMNMFKNHHLSASQYSIPYLTLNLLKAAMCVFMCAGNVTALCWDPVQRVLFSGSSDHSIIMWDIGGRKGTAFELQGHNDKVQGLCYASHTRQLISCGSDGGIVIWSMDVTRQETPEWLDSDSCQKCEQPFFWNFKQMWDSKKIGLRQHHCRKCGQAVCGKCSSKRSTIPLMGFEFEVRVCDSCHDSITDEERAPTATFHDSKHSIIHMQYEPTRGWLLTSGTDKIIKHEWHKIKMLYFVTV
uniref:WD repeat and FYVE domain containing 2 n=1 Tax=Cyprinus carpio TaxID=7962 RepID=A0A8C2HRN6_CYPCA